MIEIIYKEDNEEISNSLPVKTPKNIKQIGQSNSTKKIYIEDYVMNFVKQTPKDPDDIKFGVLLGEVKKGNGNTYIFISGGIAVRQTMEKNIIFNSEIWTELYEEIRHYFNDMQIVGWFASYPYNDNTNFSIIRKNHLDNFAGNDKVFLGYDRTENEEAFYLYEAGMLSKQESYYIYYERNDAMQEYLVDNNISAKPEITEVKRREGSYRSLIMGSKEKEESRLKENEEKKIIFKAPLIFKKTPKNKINSKKMPSLASSILIIVLLIAAIGVMENYDQMKTLNVSIRNISKDIFGLNESEPSNDFINEEEDTVQIETVNGDVEPTTETVTETAETVTTEPTTSAAALQKYYTVQEGESIYVICRKLYNDTSMVQNIINLNNLSSPDAIYAGQTLLLPY